MVKAKIPPLVSEKDRKILLQLGSAVNISVSVALVISIVMNIFFSVGLKMVWKMLATI